VSLAYFETSSTTPFKKATPQQLPHALCPVRLKVPTDSVAAADALRNYVA